MIVFPLLVSVLAGLPGWASDAQVRPLKRVKTVEVQGRDAPGELLLMPPRRVSSVTVQGPGRIAFDFYGVGLKKGRKLSAPGSIGIKRGRTALAPVELRPQPTAWTVKKRKKFK
ncbi:MAG: hypothetical protein AAFQ82_11290, partial [Myxococcota bacterium]